MSSETITRNDIVAILNKTIPGQGTDMSAQGVEDFIDDLNLSPSDYVKLSELGDYVIEQGTSGIWTYRKWNSGVAECWGTTSVTVTLSTVATYYHRGTASFSLPTNLFNSAPTIVMECHSGFWSGLQSVSASTVSAYFFDVTNATSYNLGIQVSAKGTWK